MDMDLEWTNRERAGVNGIGLIDDETDEQLLPPEAAETALAERELFGASGLLGDARRKSGEEDEDLEDDDTEDEDEFEEEDDLDDDLDDDELDDGEEGSDEDDDDDDDDDDL